MPAAVRENVFADEQQQQEAAKLFARLEEALARPKQPVFPADLQLSDEFIRFLSTVLREIAEGASITIGAVPKELSTSVAAEMLGVSRPTLMKHVRSGRLDAHKVGSHTRLLTVDVVKFRNQLNDERGRAVDALLDAESEFGL